MGGCDGAFMVRSTVTAIRQGAKAGRDAVLTANKVFKIEIVV